jgi:prevent-host-death family protein
MTDLQTTEKTIGAFDVRRNFGRLLQNILAKGDKYIVERHGEPVAVVVPMTVYKQWKENRAALFDSMRKAQQRAALSSQVAESLAQEAVEVTRARNRDEDRH